MTKDKSDTTHEQPEKSLFLQHQERIMAARAAQDIDIAERQKHSLVPAVQETAPTQGSTYQIETFDAVTGKATSRTIQPLPQPQRPVKPEVPSLSELRKQVAELTEDIEGAGSDFETVNADLDSFFAPHKALEKRISELRAALSQAEYELSELRSHGTPSEGYRRFVLEAETKVSGIARLLIERYSIDRAREKFDTEFSRLSPTTQKDLQIAIRLKLERFASQFYARLGQRNPNATIEQVKARASELLRDLQTILSENFSK